MLTLENAENVLKTVYLGTVSELLNTKVNPLMAKIQQTTNDVWGKDIRKAVKFGLNGGVGAGDEDSSLPAANPTNYLKFETSLKNLYGQIEISDKAIRATADGRGAFVDLLNSELEDLLTASKFNLGRMLYGNGSGAIAEYLFGEYISVNNVMEGMVVDIYKNTTASYRGLRVVHVDRDNKQITFHTDDVDLMDGDKLYIQGSKDKEITGLGALFDPSVKSLYGLNKTANPWLQPYVKDTAAQYTERGLEEVIDKLEIIANSNIDFLVCGKEFKYSYQDYMSKFKRNIDVMELKGGFKSLSYNGIPLIYDRFVEDNVMYLLDTSAFKLHQLCDWRYLETENGKILRQTQGKPTYSATLVKYCDLICDRPNGQAKIRGTFAGAA